MDIAALSVVIVDDDPGIRSALSDLVTAHPDLSLAGVGDSGPAATELCERFHPTVAVVDVMMPGGGRDAVRSIHRVSPPTLVVVYTARSDRRTRQQMLDAGATLVITKGDGRDITAEIVGIARLAHEAAQAPTYDDE